jgi:hypothetical protein
MKIILKKTLWFTVIRALCLVVVALFAAVGCDKSEIPPKTDNNVSFTPCQQSILKSDSQVDVEFTNRGVQIMYYDFAVTCDFTTVEVSHTLVNGVLNITQQGTPNQADCICYTDVSYTIDAISQDEVNVIFINGVQVYCHNDSDAVTQNFYVFSANFDKDDFSKDEQCGYLLFEDHGSPFDYHNLFVWAESLPEEYQDHLLPVTVTFHYKGEECGNYPIINIIKIQKQ